MRLRGRLLFARRGATIFIDIRIYMRSAFIIVALEEAVWITELTITILTIVFMKKTGKKRRNNYIIYYIYKYIYIYIYIYNFILTSLSMSETRKTINVIVRIVIVSLRS